MIRSWTATSLCALLGCSLVAATSPARGQPLDDAGRRDRPPALLGAGPGSSANVAEAARAPVTIRWRAAPGAFAETATGPDPGWAPSAPDSSPYRFPSGKEQLAAWAVNAFGPAAVAGSVTSASWGQWVIDEPPEWSGDGKGFAKRFGVASATTAITETSFSLMSAALRQDPRYYRCPCSGLGPRLAHALKMTFMARKPDGSAVFSVPKTVSPFVGPLVTRTTLYPERYTVGDGALSGAYAVLMNAGWNLAREFVLKAPAW